MYVLRGNTFFIQLVSQSVIEVHKKQEYCPMALSFLHHHHHCRLGTPHSHYHHHSNLQMPFVYGIYNTLNSTDDNTIIRHCKIINRNKNIPLTLRFLLVHPFIVNDIFSPLDTLKIKGKRGLNYITN